VKNPIHPSGVFLIHVITNGDCDTRGNFYALCAFFLYGRDGDDFNAFFLKYETIDEHLLEQHLPPCFDTKSLLQFGFAHLTISALVSVGTGGKTFPPSLIILLAGGNGGVGGVLRNTGKVLVCSRCPTTSFP
jgi:hypothetical protein